MGLMRQIKIFFVPHSLTDNSPYNSSRHRPTKNFRIWVISRWCCWTVPCTPCPVHSSWMKAIRKPVLANGIAKIKNALQISLTALLKSVLQIVESAHGAQGTSGIEVKTWGSLWRKQFRTGGNDEVSLPISPPFTTEQRNYSMSVTTVSRNKSTYFLEFSRKTKTLQK